MTTIFSTKKTLQNRFSKRILGMESLESREMLSVNPLGVDNDSAPDFVQTSATKSSENIDTPVVASSVEFATEANEITAAPVAATNSLATVSGVTTNAATVTWTKPTTQTSDGKAISKITKYTLFYVDSTQDSKATDSTWQKGIDCGTRTSWALTGLTPEKTYYFKVVITGTLKDGSAIASDTIAASGSFDTVKVEAGAAVPIGTPTNVKAAVKNGKVAVTWNAPQSYTGGYEVKFTDVTTSSSSNNLTIKVEAGKKLEVKDLAVGTFNAGTESNPPALGKDARYEIVVTASDGTITNNIGSTPTYITTGTLAAVTPAAPTAVAGTKIDDTPGGTTVKVTAGSDTDNVVVGYYIGIATSSTLPAADLSKLVYVDATTAVGSGIALKANAGEFVYAYAVGQDGTLSTGFINQTALGDAVTTDVTTAPNSHYTEKVTDINTTVTGNSVKVTWTKAKDLVWNASGKPSEPANNDLEFKVTGYRVTATLANGVSLVKYVGASSSETTFAGLNWNVKYTIAIDTIVNQETYSGSSFGNGADKIVVAGTTNADKKEITIAKLPTIAKPVAAATPVTANNTGTSATVAWAAPTGAAAGTNYLVEVLDVNKAVIATATQDALTYALTGLTPGTKYTVNVYTLGDVPGTKSAALAISVTAAAYPGATVKAATGDNKPTITTINLVVTAPDTKKFPAGAGNYYIEYTNVADAKGKPDWNAAKFYGGETPTAVTMTNGVGNVTIEKLDPNSQYFFRVVTAGNAYDSSNAWKGSGNTNQTKIVASKEIKVKTAAVPLPTITKPSLALTSDNDLTLNFTGKSLEQVIAPLAGGTKAVSLGGNAKIIYSVLVSASSTVDKATGKLLAAELVTVADNGGFVDGGENGIATNSDNNYKADNIKLTDAGLTALVLTGSTKLFDQLGNASSLKALNIQLVATINSDLTADDGAVVYSKVAKITLPKWFV